MASAASAPITHPLRKSRRAEEEEEERIMVFAPRGCLFLLTMTRRADVRAPVRAETGGDVGGGSGGPAMGLVRSTLADVTTAVFMRKSATHSLLVRFRARAQDAGYVCDSSKIWLRFRCSLGFSSKAARFFLP